jgi:hypothetical protein
MDAGVCAEPTKPGINQILQTSEGIFFFNFKYIFHKKKKFPFESIWLVNN